MDDVAGDLEAVDAMIAGSPDLIRLVRSPVISREDQGRAIGAVLEAADVAVPRAPVRRARGAKSTPVRTPRHGRGLPELAG